MVSIGLLFILAFLALMSLGVLIMIAIFAPTVYLNFFTYVALEEASIGLFKPLRFIFDYAEWNKWQLVILHLLLFWLPFFIIKYRYLIRKSSNKKEDDEQSPSLISIVVPYLIFASTFSFLNIQLIDIWTHSERHPLYIMFILLIWSGSYQYITHEILDETSTKISTHPNKTTRAFLGAAGVMLIPFIFVYLITFVLNFLFFK